MPARSGAGTDRGAPWARRLITRARAATLRATAWLANEQQMPSRRRRTRNRYPPVIVSSIVLIG